jgi:flagellar basal body-associated protein FliL
MIALLLDMPPPRRSGELFVIIAVVVIVIAVVVVLAVATGIFVFIRMQRSRAAARSISKGWAGTQSSSLSESASNSPNT